VTPEEIKILVEEEIQKAVQPVEEKLNEILRIINKFEGAGTLVKTVFLAILPAIAIFTWLKDHFK